jgi:hypothetical protein
VYSISDYPKVRVDDRSLSVGLDVKWTTYVGVFYQRTPFKDSVYYPMAKIKWSIDYRQSGDGVDISQADITQSDFTQQRSTETHVFETTQKLAPAFAPYAIRREEVSNT